MLILLLFVAMYDTIQQFNNFLKQKTSVPASVSKFYIRWINLCNEFLKIEQGTLGQHNSKERFLSHLVETCEKWQVRQADYALNLYIYFLSQLSVKSNPNGIDSAAEWIVLAIRVHESMRLKHLSRRTEETYLKWLRSFYSFVNHKDPADLTSDDARDFLSYLAAERKVSAATQNELSIQ